MQITRYTALFYFCCIRYFNSYKYLYVFIGSLLDEDERLVGSTGFKYIHQNKHVIAKYLIAVIAQTNKQKR